MEVFLDRNFDFSLYIFLFTTIRYTDIIQLVETKRYRLWNRENHSIHEYDEKKRNMSPLQSVILLADIYGKWP